MFLYFMCALVGGLMFYRWWRMSPFGRNHTWPLYGWMTALTCCGSLCGVLTWGAWMGYLVNEYTGQSLLSTDPFADRFVYFSRAEQWVAM